MTVALLAVVFMCVFAFMASQVVADIEYEVADWHEPGLGNVRAIIEVENASDAVRVHIPWRRDDVNYSSKGVVVYDMQSEKQVRNVYVVQSDRESADVIFQPASGAGQYAFYYMPYIRPEKLLGQWLGDYIPPHNIAEADWLKKHRLDEPKSWDEKFMVEYGGDLKFHHKTLITPAQSTQFSILGVQQDYENNDYTLGFEAKFKQQTGRASAIILPQRFDKPPTGYQCMLEWRNGKLYAQIKGTFVVPTKIWGKNFKIGTSESVPLDVDPSQKISVNCRAQIYDDRTEVVMICSYVAASTGKLTHTEIKLEDTHDLRLKWGRSPVFATQGECEIGNISIKNATGDEVFATQTRRIKNYSGQRDLPMAKVVAFQGRGEMNRISPMRVIASSEEMRDMLAGMSRREVLLFAASGRDSIKMVNFLPQQWAQSGPFQSLTDSARPGEYYTFQLGVYCQSDAIEITGVEFHDLESMSGGSTIPAEAMVCFNLEGNNHIDGAAFKKKAVVPAGKVYPLWFGIEIPADAAGKYSTELNVMTSTGLTKPVRVALEIAGEVVENHGDADMSRLSRLRWLNSTVGMEPEDVSYPYEPVKISGSTVSILKRDIVFGDRGLPTSIKSFGQEILEGPITFEIQGKRRSEDFRVVENEVVSHTASSVERRTLLASANFELTLISKTDYAGIMTYSVSVRSLNGVDVQDIRIQIPMNKRVARYMIGFARQAGSTPEQYTWKWNPEKAHNVGWFGDISAGLGLRLLPENINTWEMRKFTDFAGYVDWYNESKGSVTFETSETVFEVNASTGPMAISRGDTVTMNFRLFVTPFKPVNANHWNDHLNLHSKPGVGNIKHLHHGGYVEPYINYPFSYIDRLKKEIKPFSSNSEDRGANLYYTCREVSAHAPEIFAFRSLGDELLLNSGSYVYAIDMESYQGSGGGAMWLRENLKSGYSPGWIQSVMDSLEVDYAVGTNPNSRMLNFYVAGLDYLRKRLGNFGLYLDGIGYGGETTQRLARILSRDNPTYRIAFHTGNLGNHKGAWKFVDEDRFCPMARNLEHLPYVTSLMFGEMFEFAQGPDYWLLEMSGLPFGLTNDFYCHEMSMNSAYKPLLYGGVDIHNPHVQAMWEFLDAWQMDQAQMTGYWEQECPVTTNRDDVLATVYRKNDEMLIAIASWAKEPVDVRLNFKNGQAFSLYAPAIQGLQETRTWSSDQAIEIQPNRGVVLIVNAEESNASP